MHSAPFVSFRRIALLVAGLSMFGPFAIDAVFPAFPRIGSQFGLDKLALQQVISVYLLAYALMSLVHGALSDALGRKRVIVGGLLVFIAASRWPATCPPCCSSAPCRGCRPGWATSSAAR